MKPLYQYSINHPRVCLGTLIVVTLLLGTGLSKLAVRNDTESNLPASNPILATQARIKAIFGISEHLIFALHVEPTIYRLDTLKKLKYFADEAQKLPGVKPSGVLSLATSNSLYMTNGFLYTGPLMKSLPSDERKIQELRKKVQEDPVVFGRLISKDETTAFILVELDKNVDQRIIADAAQELQRRFQEPEEVYLIGPKVLHEEVEQGIFREFNLFFIAAFLIAGLSFYAFMRSGWLSFLPLIMAGLTLIWTSGLQGWLGMPLTVVSSVLPIFLIAISSSYNVHGLRHYLEKTETSSKDARQLLSDAFRDIHPGLWCSLCTAVLGTLSLFWFRVGWVQQFAIISTVGTIFAYVSSQVALPAILVIWMPRANRVQSKVAHRHWESSIQEHLIQWVVWLSRHVWLFCMCVFCVSLISVWGSLGIIANLDASKMFSSRHAMSKNIQFFKEKGWGVYTLEMMVELPGADSVFELDNLRSMERLQHFIESQPEVNFVDSVLDVIKTVHKAFDGQFTLPPSSRLASQYVLLYQMSGRSTDLNAYLDSSAQRTRWVIYYRSTGTADTENLMQRIQDFARKDLLPEFRLEFAGSSLMWSAINEYVVEGKVLNIVSNAPLLLLWIAVVHRCFLFGLLGIVPWSLATLFTFGLMGFLKIDLDVATAIITSVAASVGVDSAIHLLERFRHWRIEGIENTLRTTGLTIIYESMANIFGFSALLLSGFQPIKDFALLVSFNLLISLLGTLSIIPLILIVVPERWFCVEGKFWAFFSRKRFYKVDCHIHTP
jgi:uncharacterized protein